MKKRSEGLDLLADVRADVAAEAEREQAQIVAAREAREAEALRRLAEAEAERRTEAEARREAERRRQELVAQQRAERLAPQPIMPAVAAAPRPVEPTAPSPALPIAPPSRGTGFWFVVVSLPVVCVTAIAFAWIMRDRVEAPVFQAPSTFAMPEVADAPGAVPSLPEVMPLASTVTEPAATVRPAVHRPKPRPRPRPVKPKPKPKPTFDIGPNILETDDTRKK